MIKKFEVEKDFHNTRFDRWFKNKVLDIPQGLIEKIIRKNQVKVNKKKTKSSYRVQENDIIEVFNIEKIKHTEKNIITQYVPTNTERDKYDDFIIEDNENFISFVESFKHLESIIEEVLKDNNNVKKRISWMPRFRINTDAE